MKERDRKRERRDKKKEKEGGGDQVKVIKVTSGSNHQVSIVFKYVEGEEK